MTTITKPTAARQASGAWAQIAPLRGTLNDAGVILPITPATSLPSQRERTVGLCGACCAFLGFVIVMASLALLLLVMHT